MGTIETEESGSSFHDTGYAVDRPRSWTVGYNAVAMALAAAGLLTPSRASLAMIASSVAVVANTERLRRGPALASAAGSGPDAEPASALGFSLETEVR